MFYALFKSEKLIGIFDSEDYVENMINGIVQNKFCNKNKLSIRKFNRNAIHEVTNEEKNKDIKIVEKELDLVIQLSPEEEEKRNKKM